MGPANLARELARHLVQGHGVRHLLLTSRRGLKSPGAVELVANLQALGAQTVQVASCDVSDREAVCSLLGGIAANRPLTGVFHLAGMLDDGIVPALTGERLERVLRPKVDGAWHIHELTMDQDLAAFVLFSSAAGLGSPGQANYAAANVFLDALAAERRHRGLAAQSLVWGFWEQRGVGMTAHLGRAELTRMRRMGVQPLSLELGLELLDAALSRPDAVLIPLHLDLVVMQRQFGGPEVPALYRGLLRSDLKRASTSSADTNALRVRLAALTSEAERLQALVEVAQEDIAAVLALPGASSVPADVPLKELGMDSLMAVALRNRLSGRIGTKLPTTLAFDYPTARAIARLLLEKLSLNERAMWGQGAAAGSAAKSKTEWLKSVQVLLRGADPEFLRKLDLERRLSGLAEMGALLEQSDSSCIVPIRPGFGNRVMIYIAGLGHGATRGNSPPVITQLGGDYPIAGLNPYPLAARGLLSGSIADLASSYLPHVESWIGDRSVFFVGSSFGGLVGMALASELERRGRHVAGVALLDTLTPGSGILPLPIDELKEMACSYLIGLYGLAVHENERLAELTGAPSVEALREMIGDNYQCHSGWTLPALAAPVHLLHAEEFVATPGLVLKTMPSWIWAGAGSGSSWRQSQWCRAITPPCIPIRRCLVASMRYSDGIRRTTQSRRTLAEMQRIATRRCGERLNDICAVAVLLCSHEHHTRSRATSSRRRSSHLTAPGLQRPTLCRYGKRFESSKARPSSVPANVIGWQRQFQLRPALEESFKRALALHARQLMSQTEMHARSERHLAIGFPCKIQLFRVRICLRVHVGSGQHRHDPVAFLQMYATKIDILADEARLGELHGRDEAQKFLDRQVGAAPVFLEPIAQLGCLQYLVDRPADQMRGRFRSRTEKQKDHRQHLLAADATAFLFDANEFCDQTFTAAFAGDLQPAFQIFLHRLHPGHHAEEAAHAIKLGNANGPADKPGSIGTRQSEQFADRQKRQPERIALDQIGCLSLSEEFGRKLIGDRKNSWFHVEDGAPTECLVDDSAKALVIRCVHAQHADCERAYPPRHHPAKNRHQPAPGILAHRECIAVLQDTLGHLMGGGDPGLPEHREAHLQYRACIPQLCNAHSRIAEVVLAGQIRQVFLASNIRTHFRRLGERTVASESDEVADVFKIEICAVVIRHGANSALDPRRSIL